MIRSLMKSDDQFRFRHIKRFHIFSSFLVKIVLSDTLHTLSDGPMTVQPIDPE